MRMLMAIVRSVGGVFRGLQLNLLRRPRSRREALQRLAVVGLMVLAGVGAFLVGADRADVAEVADESFLAQRQELADARSELALLRDDEEVPPVEIEALETRVDELQDTTFLGYIARDGDAPRAGALVPDFRLLDLDGQPGPPQRPGPARDRQLLGLVVRLLHRGDARLRAPPSGRRRPRGRDRRQSRGAAAYGAAVRQAHGRHLHPAPRPRRHARPSLPDHRHAHHALRPRRRHRRHGQDRLPHVRGDDRPHQSPARRGTRARSRAHRRGLRRPRPRPARLADRQPRRRRGVVRSPRRRSVPRRRTSLGSATSPRRRRSGSPTSGPGAT